MVDKLAPTCRSQRVGTKDLGHLLVHSCRVSLGMPSPPKPKHRRVGSFLQGKSEFENIKLKLASAWTMFLSGLAAHSGNWGTWLCTGQVERGFSAWDSMPCTGVHFLAQAHPILRAYGPLSAALNPA